MLNWLRKLQINELLVKVARDEAYIKSLAKCGEEDSDVAGRVAANKERLRQLGYKEHDNG